MTRTSSAALAHRPSPTRPAVLYARVSSKEQERKGYSIAAQRKLLRQYAKDRDLRVLHEFVDVETAKSTGRKEYARMVAFLHDHPGCRILLVEKTDRLYRNLKDWVRLEDLELEVHLVKEGAILSPESRSNEKFMHGIRVLMAKNYIDNLSEEVKKGLQEKADQGHWPTVAPIGYLNNRRTHLIEPDPDRAPAINALFERYATGDVSLIGLTATAFGDGLTHPRSGRRLTKSEIHRMLHNPIYYGAFRWKGKLYQGCHVPIISKELFDAVQSTFASANRPRYTKHRHAFAGLLTCGLCGCAITAELKKGKYIYYHCTGHRGRCGNTYILEENLGELLAEVVRRIQITPDIADEIADALRVSQDAKERYHRETVGRLGRLRDTLQRRLNRGYDDLLSGKITEQLWSRKSKEWESELESTLGELARHDHASSSYAATGARILELSQNAHSLYVSQERTEQRRLLNTLLSNCTFERGSLTPTYNKPFDLLAAGNETGEWLGGRDSNPDYTVQSRVSYH